MEKLTLYFNSRILKIIANIEELLKSETRFLTVKKAEGDEEVIINLDQVLWISKISEDQNEY